jgi:hypothetical protein
MVRWGRLYRSMTPQYMTRGDARRAQKLDIGLVIDFEAAATRRPGRSAKRHGALPWVALHRANQPRVRAFSRRAA